MSTAVAAPTIAPDHAWIVAEFSKGIDAEAALAAEAKSRAETPPEPDLAILYHEIAADDERHRGLVEAIAVRYGHTLSKSAGGGIGSTLGHLKGKLAEMGSGPMDRVAHDLNAKANSVHWSTAWVAAFEAIGDTDSARKLAAVLAEERTHLEALQQGLNRMVVRGASGAGTSV